jgi:hypothetical protein
MTNTLPTLALIFVLAFLAESLTEYFARPIFGMKPPDPDADRTIPTSPLYLRYIAACVGILLACLYRVDLLALFGLHAIHPVAGWVLTGILAGRGSNYLHDLVDRWLSPQPKPRSWP